ncbi:MAG: hypothetical protein QOI85_1992 [Chloroflexota bacterium]|jgi:hypothetical protein|nr:hypothetical protein [Chloroflexota bacterium]
MLAVWPPHGWESGAVVTLVAALVVVGAFVFWSRRERF